MTIRDRIRELRRVRAGDLRPNPHNWRTHPAPQRDALRGLLEEVGYAGALVARELPDGRLQLIDGHLRAETTPEMEVPVLVVDLDDEETAKVLALFDPLGAMAGSDRNVLCGLRERVETRSEALRAVLDRIGGPLEAAPEKPESPSAEVTVPELFQVIVECPTESEQKTLFERLKQEGYDCRLLNL
ncbi:MAG: ParB N-terminal domain-containing protein [Rhodopirellula sp.]|nr:ParB N-terminal domain-containing protein [Rhodopirellula sp.]